MTKEDEHILKCAKWLKETRIYLRTGIRVDVTMRLVDEDEEKEGEGAWKKEPLTVTRAR